MANTGFERDVLRIQLSDLNPRFAEHSLGIGATFYICGMSVIITNDEDLMQDSFCRILKLINFMTGGR